MQHLSTACVIITLVIAVHQGSGVTANERKVDQVAVEAKHRAVTIIGGPKYVDIKPKPPTPNQKSEPTVKTFNKPPVAGKPGKHYYIAPARHYYGHIQKIPPRSHYNKLQPKFPYSPNSIYKYPRVIPLPPHLKNHYYKTRQLAVAASSNKVSIAKSPKFSLPVQTINGIRKDIVRPPKSSPPFALNTTTTTTTTTTESTTTTRALRTKRIWPSKELTTTPLITTRTTETSQSTTKSNLNVTVTDSPESIRRARVVRNVTTTTTEQPSTVRTYRPVTRTPKIKSTTVSMKPINFTKIEYNDWVPITPSHYPRFRKLPTTSIIKRSDYANVKPEIPLNKRMLYWHTYGLIPVTQPPTPGMARKKMVFFNRKRQLNPHYSGYRHTPQQYIYEDQEPEGSQHSPKVITKIKHHHHHHHHRYIKTIEKPVKVPYKIEVPKPYPVTVEKKVPVPVEKIKIVEKRVPYPVTVEKKVPYPVEVKVPHPVPYKVIEREYVPKPYPIVHHVPIIKHVQVRVPQPVPVTVEKKVPYPVQVKVPVPVDRPVPVHITVEKKVPYAVPVKVLVPQPYPVETKVPYPVEVKQPVEVIKHVPVKVPYPQPYPVKVPHPVPVPVEKKVPYPVEVEKKVPVPVQVYVPHKVEVEKKVPVYVPKPYPVEKPVPVAVKVPVPYKVPVQVPVKIPVEVPVFIHHPFVVGEEDHYDDHFASGPILVSEDNVTHQPLEHTVTVHGNRDLRIESRSDTSEVTTATPSS
ncbi:hypothetical protein K1T71_011914 [Dendrolimus kikuchii]|uniref:Uncharacterized protein n=1 Tax=Dendrolimus kikuchii TaxID=765133 RepID=A0ACC1CMD4_9NEOP|nr:hypothetical protein K1T71_011914 [Dendrolimus kikuchii]